MKQKIKRKKRKKPYLGRRIHFGPSPNYHRAAHVGLPTARLATRRQPGPGCQPAGNRPARANDVVPLTGGSHVQPYRFTPRPHPFRYHADRLVSRFVTDTTTPRRPRRRYAAAPPRSSRVVDPTAAPGWVQMRSRTRSFPLSHLYPQPLATTRTPPRTARVRPLPPPVQFRVLRHCAHEFGFVGLTVRRGLIRCRLGRGLVASAPGIRRRGWGIRRGRAARVDRALWGAICGEKPSTVFVSFPIPRWRGELKFRARFGRIACSPACAPPWMVGAPPWSGLFGASHSWSSDPESTALISHELPVRGETIQGIEVRSGGADVIGVH
jgi:hypothetical protein